jgi:proteasome lid subunit RPN8/RPN11
MPERDIGSMFAIILLLAVSANASKELFQPDAVEQYARLNALASTTRYESERAAFLVRRLDGGLTTVVWQARDHAEASYVGRIPLRCVAVIHTHPPVAPQPSKQDMAEARRIGLPIIVITPQSVIVATPQGRADQLFGAGWTRRANSGRSQIVSR